MVEVSMNENPASRYGSSGARCRSAVTIALGDVGIAEGTRR